MWFTIARKLILPCSSGSYTVKSFLAHQLKSFVEPCLQTSVNSVSSVSVSNDVKLKTSRTKVESDKNVPGENRCVKSLPVKKYKPRKDAVSKEVLQYLISTGMEKFLDRIPKRMLNLKRRPPEMRYLLNENFADEVVDAVKEDLLRNDSPILDASPGLGFVTRKLLELPVSRIQLYETSYDFRFHLKDLVKENPDRVTITDFNLFSVAKLVYQDKFDNGTRLHKLLQDLPRKEWTADEPAMKIIGVLPTLNFIKHLMLSLIFQCGMMMYGRPELYLLMEPIFFTHLICDGTAGYLHYRTSSVLFQLIFEWQVLLKLPLKAVIPWHVGYPKKKFPRLNKLQEQHSEWVYLVKCVPKRDFYETVVPSDQLQQLWFFVRHNLSSRNNRVIPMLERWVPGCGPRVIVKGLDIFTKFGDLSPQEILALFRDFVSWPEYADCPFLASVEYAYLKMEPGSEVLDESPAGQKTIDYVEDEVSSEEISEDVDQKLL